MATRLKIANGILSLWDKTLIKHMDYKTADCNIRHKIEVIW